jgi:2-haloacid dehalogenase
VAHWQDVQILAFDVFGTVVDWHGTIVREVESLQLKVNAAEFARAWRAGYQPAMARVMSGELGWTRIDDLHRIILDDVLVDFGITLTEQQCAELNLVWHRLTPWPDVIDGLPRLRAGYTVCTLSNGNLSLLANMAKHSAIPWDLILSAEVFRAYKPHPDTYLGVASVFDVSADNVMLVAAHHDDLEAARDCGLRTAYIERPLESGADQLKDVSPVDGNDLHCKDFNDLADKLGV